MNIKVFAARLGVSTATVSRAFSERGRISPVTRAHIREMAMQLGYFPNRQARSMVRGSTDALAVFYDAPQEADSDYYLAEIIHGIAAAADNAEMLLQMYAVSAEARACPERIADLVRTGAVDGFIIYLQTDWAGALMAAGAELGIPYVIIDNTRPASVSVLSIGDAIESACGAAGAYLRQCGRRQPAFIHGLHDAGKLRGFKSGLGALAEHLVCDPGGVSFAQAWTAFNRLYDQFPNIDAVLCGNDVLAMGAVRAALDRGLRVPQDVAFIGCDDLAMASFCNPALTTVRLPKQQLGEQAVAKLMGMLRGREASPTTESLTCELVVRESA